MAWEAINNIAVDNDLPLVIVVNDNERSYAPTIGGLADHLATLRTTRGYERFLDWGKRSLARTPVVGGAMFETLHGVKKGIKDIVAPQGMFEDLGLKYLGPVDGHDEQALERALRKARGFGGPVIVHVITQKGRGYQPAIDDEADQFHAVGKYQPRDRAALRGRRAQLDRRVQRGDGGDRGASAPTSSRSPPRCSSRSGSTASPPPTPTASSTSASPSSTP